jgi:enoyl-CoA hydratase/carnithine racemase
LLQVGSFGSDGLPVVLCIQHEPGELRAALAELGLRLQRPFALLAQTGRLMDAHCHAMIASARARFFGLESNLRLMASGTLVAEKQAADLFAALAPEPAKELGPGEAARVFRLFGELLGMGTDLVAPPARVFDLMVFKKMTKAEAALECGCVASLITKRVTLIERHFAIPMERLRAFASNLKERQRTVRGDRYAKKKQGAARDEPEQHDAGDKEDDNGYLPEER